MRKKKKKKKTTQKSHSIEVPFKSSSQPLFSFITYNEQLIYDIVFIFFDLLLLLIGGENCFDDTPHLKITDRNHIITLSESTFNTRTVVGGNENNTATMKSQCWLPLEPLLISNG